ncbi:MAG: VWA domain-containing protein [Polyangiales bacterium]
MDASRCGRVGLPAAGGALAGGGLRARWEIGGGVLLLADANGHRWRVRVDAGSLGLSSEGANSVGRTVWTPGDGTLNVTVIVAGDRELALEGEVTAGVTVASATPAAPLAPGSLAALDELMAAAPEGSEESLRLASAVEIVTRANTPGGPAFFAVPVRGRSIVLVVDVSYSMRDVDPRASDLWLTPTARPTKLDVARAELVKLLGALPADVRVDVVAFSSTARTLWPAPRALDAAARSEAIRWVAALRPGDETAPVVALEAAASLQPEQIVLLSDGRPTDRDGDERALLGLAQGISARIRLDVVGIGPDQDRPFLAALAQSGRGELRMR